MRFLGYFIYPQVMDATTNSNTNKRSSAPTTAEEIFYEVAASHSEYTKEDIERTHTALFKTLRVMTSESILLLDQNLLVAMRNELVVGLVFDLQQTLRKSKTSERPTKRAKTGPHKGNATSSEQLADKIVNSFPYPNLLDEALPKRKADFIVRDLTSVHCNICDKTLTLNHNACPSRFYRHLFGTDPGTVTRHLRRANNNKQMKKNRPTINRLAETLRSKLSQSEGRVLCLCTKPAVEENIGGKIYYVCSARLVADETDDCRFKVEKKSTVDEGHKQSIISLLQKSASRQVDPRSQPHDTVGGSLISWKASMHIHLLKQHIHHLEASYKRVYSARGVAAKQGSMKAHLLQFLKRLLSNTAFDAKVWHFVDTLLNHFRNKSGKRYHPSTIEVGKKIKMRGGSGALAFSPLPSKSTINREKSSHLKAYGISPQLVELAKQYYQAKNIFSAHFIIALDGIYVPEDDNICFSSRTRHGFIVPDNTTILRVNSYSEVEKPFVQGWPYARQVVVVLLCPLVPGYQSFPIGLLPTAVTYDTQLTKSLFERALLETQKLSFNILAISADNASGHAAYFSDQVKNQPFVLPEWPFGTPCNRPVPLVDYLHVGRKICNQVINPKRVIMIGEIPVLIQPLLDLQKTIDGFNVRIMKHQDAQYQQRVDFLLGSRELQYKLDDISAADGLATYLRMMQRFYYAFASKEWSWKQRIYAAWQAVCFLVYTRRYVDETRGLTLGDNHITTQTYNAILLTVSSLVACAQQWHAPIAPWLLYEYWCENFFSTVRSWIQNKASVTVTEIWHIVNEIIDARLMESPATSQAPKLPSDRLTNTEIAAILLGADYEVRELLGQECFGMTALLSKYHDVIACVNEEASINRPVSPNCQIPTPIDIPLETTLGHKSQRSHHIFVPINQEEMKRFEQRFNIRCDHWLPLPKLLNLFGTNKRQYQNFSRERERRPIASATQHTSLHTDDNKALRVKEWYLFKNVKDEDPTTYYGTILQIAITAHNSLTVVPEASIEEIKYMIVYAQIVADKEEPDTLYPAKYFIISSFIDWNVELLPESMKLCKSG